MNEHGLLDEPDGPYSFPVIEGAWYSPTGKMRILGYQPQNLAPISQAAMRADIDRYKAFKYGPGWRIVGDDELDDLG